MGIFLMTSVPIHFYLLSAGTHWKVFEYYKPLEDIYYVVAEIL